MTVLTEPMSAASLSTPPEPPAFDWIDAPDGKLYELVDGKPVVKRVSMRSMWIATQIAHLLKTYVDPNGLGFVFVEQPVVGVWNKKHQGRRPDVCFVSKTRLPALPPKGELEVAPDLAVEVVSPHDNVSYLEEKLVEYRLAGVRLVWVVIPETRSVRVFQSDGTSRPFDLTQTLDGSDVLPGFACPVADIFPKT